MKKNVNQLSHIRMISYVAVDDAADIFTLL